MGEPETLDGGVREPHVQRAECRHRAFGLTTGAIRTCCPNQHSGRSDRRRTARTVRICRSLSRHVGRRTASFRPTMRPFRRNDIELDPPQSVQGDSFTHPIQRQAVAPPSAPAGCVLTIAPQPRRLAAKNLDKPPGQDLQGRIKGPRIPGSCGARVVMSAGGRLPSPRRAVRWPSRSSHPRT